MSRRRLWITQENHVLYVPRDLLRLHGKTDTIIMSQIAAFKKRGFVNVIFRAMKNVAWNVIQEKKKGGLLFFSTRLAGMPTVRK